MISTHIITQLVLHALQVFEVLTYYSVGYVLVYEYSNQKKIFH